ncbi:Phosphotransferase enzyme family protein [Streptomyces sp. DvalAA-14]|uniref:phosphotransferase n=1 Tax=unclassified Streptomyces TaxID=2593676 RepID=UPI00081BBE05|nr:MULTISPECIES: phosphotransferase [unclassified Streptomyces]MYS22112.1 phosphotransferase [Streptomyces sp. SID4948]SCE08856.1 Phosphotransferase enzyme family protein [Streptomyces sp. DvalAA-14]
MAAAGGEEVLAGGGVNHVVRTGRFVRRPAGPWSPAVHALLAHVRAAGFAGAPLAHGFDDQGREILDHLPGDVPDYPLARAVRSDAALVAVAVLLRGYHDATVGFVPPAGARWYRPTREPADVVCHGDIAPYNCVFRQGRPVAFIDFDTAHPGPRVWDVAYAAYRFVPLTGPGNPDFTAPVAEQTRRLALFADAYGLDAAARVALPVVARGRLADLVRHMHDRAAAGVAAFAEHIAQGHDVLYRADQAHIAGHEAAFVAALR